MPVSRMRMRQWLEDRLESQSISGLVWLDKDKKIFSIPWKHAARHGWEIEKDACLFKQWAIHTGKYKVGMSAPDPKTWKANFRCAMNSLPDIVEVKDKSINKGCGAVRVYKMLQNVSKKKDKRSRTKDSKQKTKEMEAVLQDEVQEQEISHCEGLGSTQSEESLPEVGSTEQFFSQDFSSSQYSTDEESSELSNSAITPDSTGGFMSFQVSPDHSTDYDEKLGDIEDLSQLQDLLSGFWVQSNVVDTTEPSPEDLWCETPGQEIEVRFYTELRGGLMDSDDNVSGYEWPISSVLQQTT